MVRAAIIGASSAIGTVYADRLKLNRYQKTLLISSARSVGGKLG
jgi:aspartate-semialdehyde dehydrogenase